MKHDMMWAYLIHLSTNMWGDPGSRELYAPYYSPLRTDDRVWRETIDYLPGQGINTVLIDLGDAVQYESHPEIAIPGAWSKDKLKAELDRIRSLGMVPLPKLNFSAAHDAWLGKYSRMLSTPEYYRVCADLIREAAELFGNPAYFHLGLDEENLQNQLSYEYCCIRQGELWWHDIYFLFDACEKVGARPWVWSDPHWTLGEEYLRRMPKSVLQSNWCYVSAKKRPDGSYERPEFETYRILERAGFDQVPTSSAIWHWYNSRETMALGREEIAPERLKGFMTAPWYDTSPENDLALLGDAKRFGDAKRLVYPEACQ